MTTLDDQTPVTIVYGCGPKRTCPDGTEHDYSACAKVSNGETAVCVKCGHHAIDDAYWED